MKAMVPRHHIAQAKVSHDEIHSRFASDDREQKKKHGQKHYK
jgi:hypothetical protein